jgi:hypothetical protein
MLDHAGRNSRKSSTRLRSGCRFLARPEEVESRLAPSAEVSVTTAPGVQQVPSIAVDPLDSRHEVVAHVGHSLLATGCAHRRRGDLRRRCLLDARLHFRAGPH